MQQRLEELLGSWQGQALPDLEFPALQSVAQKEVNYRMNRDQVVLAFAGLSVRRRDPDYDKLLLFDQVLTGGVLNSMNSRLFQIRERTGLFYTVGGSLLNGSHMEPGMIFIKTVVSPEKLQEAEKLIGKVLDDQAQDLTEQELLEAKRAVTHALVDNFSNNKSIANSFMFMDKFKLPRDFFAKRAETLNSITLQDVQEAIKRHVATDKFARIRIGRL